MSVFIVLVSVFSGCVCVYHLSLCVRERITALLEVTGKLWEVDITKMPLGCNFVVFEKSWSLRRVIIYNGFWRGI